jgi:hypothetical protein
MINSTPDGEHMNIETFRKALELTLRIDPSLIFISGGEPTDHPQFLHFAEVAKEYAKQTSTGKVLVGSNGMFLDDESYTKRILDTGVSFQITNDPRFYPKRIKEIEHPSIIYEEQIRLVSPFGRALTNNIASQKQGPMCFNLRSLCLHYGALGLALIHLRYLIKVCTPSINIDGSIVAGESSSCCKIGDVGSTDEELLKNIRTMKCGKCGLHKGLTGAYADQWNKFENYKEEESTCQTTSL